jgi:hypothetical protein
VCVDLELLRIFERGVCVRDRESARERESEKERHIERAREGESERERHVCERAYIYRETQ